MRQKPRRESQNSVKSQNIIIPEVFVYQQNASVYTIGYLQIDKKNNVTLCKHK